MSLRTVIFGKCQRALEGDATKMQHAIDTGIGLLTRKRLTSTDIIDETFNKNLEMQLEVLSLFFGKRLLVTAGTTPAESPKFTQGVIEEYQAKEGEESAALKSKMQLNDEALTIRSISCR